MYPSAKVGIKAPSGLGGDDDLLRAFTLQLGQQSFAVSVAVNIGRVKKVDAKIDGAMQCRQGLAIIHATPGTTDRPGPETYT